MNKTAIKNFAIWARNKLIADICYRAGLMGITEKGIADPLPQSTLDAQFYDIGATEPYLVAGEAIKQRRQLVEVIRDKEKNSDYRTAYQYVMEEVAYTWFNRLIAVRFMEVNDYLPSHLRVLSSESGKVEPDLVTTPFDAELPFTAEEEAQIIQWKQDNKLDELFRFLFIKQCNALNEILPGLFEKTTDYTEVLLNLSVVDQEGVVYKLTHDIPEKNFNIEQGGQVEIIGWLYQYYNTALNEQVYDGRFSRDKIPKELLPAATTIYTPDWAIRYMVENSLGRLWVEGHPDSDLRKNWKYYLDEAPQEPQVQAKLAEIRKEYAALNPKDLTLIDPCMGSGHILVYAFDVLMQIYESVGYSQRDAAKSILEHNLYGLDIDDRAYQLAYFAVMMKARQYNRRILNGENTCHVHAIQESNPINRAHLKFFGAGLSDLEKNTAKMQLEGLLDILTDAKEYGSILNVPEYNWVLLRRFVSGIDDEVQISLESAGVEQTAEELQKLIDLGETMARKYWVTVTNPPYLGKSRFSVKLGDYVNSNYPEAKADLSMVMLRHALGDISKQNGLVSFITTSSWMFLSSFEKLREYLFSTSVIDTLVDFGTELFDGKVGHNPITAWVNRRINLDYNVTAIRLVDYCFSRRNEKEVEFFNEKNRYHPKQSDFAKIPSSPVAYWVSERIFELFSGKTIGEYYDVKAGMCTGENATFILCWQEVDYTLTNISSPTKYMYTAHNKGGEYHKWYGNRELVLKYNDNALKLMESNAGFRHDGKEYYFKEHIGWSKITSGKSSFRYFENGFTFDSAGLGLFPKKKQDMFLTLAFLNSKVAEELIALLNPTLNVTPMVVKKLPFTDLIVAEKASPLTKDNIELCKEDWDSFETSWKFTTHPLVKLKMAGANPWGNNNKSVIRLATVYKAWEITCDGRFDKLKANEEELNRIFIDIYGLQDELTPEVEDKDVTVRKADLQRDIKSLLSYAVGCMFGRYSLDSEGLAYAGGDWDESKYKTFLPDVDGIIPITDEEYLGDDIVTRLCSWLKIVYGEDTLEENVDFIAKALGGRGSSSREIIRNYFLKDFFKDHCKIYQKRPIYWLFDSGKQNGFKALIYLHRYTPDTIGNLRVDYLHKMQRVYESEISRMQDMIDNSQNAREVAASTKRKEKLQKQLKECRDYDEMIAHLALSRIELDLDDGVKINYEKVQTASDGKKYSVLAKI